MLKVDTKNIDKYERFLIAFHKQAIPFAEVATVNSKAFKAQEFARENINRQMIKRTPFTLKSVQVEKATRTKQYSIVGSIADYMAKQELGDIKIKDGKEGVPIPTTVSSGEGRSASERLKKVTKKNLLANIRLLKRDKYKAKNKKQEFLVRMKLAVQTKKRVFYFDGGSKKGIYRVKGGRINKRGTIKGARVDLLYDLSKSSVSTPPNPWLLPAAEKANRMTFKFYKNAIMFQIKRLRRLNRI